jgi:hypothetical protein
VQALKIVKEQNAMAKKNASAQNVKNKRYGEKRQGSKS